MPFVTELQPQFYAIIGNEYKKVQSINLTVLHLPHINLCIFSGEGKEQIPMYVYFEECAIRTNEIILPLHTDDDIVEKPSRQKRINHKLNICGILLWPEHIYIHTSRPSLNRQFRTICQAEHSSQDL